MKTTKANNATAAFERALAKPDKSQFELRLYVAGTTLRSTHAIANLKEICEKHLKGHYQLRVIDIYQQPTLPAGDQIIAVPTLIRKLPPPLRRLVGDLSDRERVLIGLDIKPQHTEASAL